VTSRRARRARAALQLIDLSFDKFGVAPANEGEAYPLRIDLNAPARWAP
jgi:hypothetical protein